MFDPAYESTVFARIVGIVSGIPGQFGELGTALWLLIMGARVRKATMRPAALGASSMGVATP